MEVVHARGGGLDVHRQAVTACVLVSGERPGRPRQEGRAFATMTADRLALADWLAAHEVTHVAMERTGVDWKPR